MSRIYTVAPCDGLDRQIVQRLDIVGRIVEQQVVSKSPIFCVPIGVIRFCAAERVGDVWPPRPRACMALASRSICTSRVLPPKG